jgi:hypothetical protein
MRLIENCRRKWWRLWTVQLSAASAAVSAYVWASPDVVVSVLTQIPTWLRLTAIGAFLALRILARIYHQPEVPPP